MDITINGHRFYDGNCSAPKIQAIKFMRNEFELGLKEAKNCVEHAEADGITDGLVVKGHPQGYGFLNIRIVRRTPADLRPEIITEQRKRQFVSNVMEGIASGRRVIDLMFEELDELNKLLQS